MVNISFQQERKGQISTLKKDPQYTSSYFKRKTDESTFITFQQGTGSILKVEI